MEEVRYSANGFDYKFIKEKDGWWSIYRYHNFRGEFLPLLQSKDLEHCKSYCELCEAITIPLKEL